ncbi:MAG: NosD domain-containing protein [Candidatus Hodarchaeales archaeon]
MESAGFPGTGTKTDPFVINGFKIVNNYSRNLINLINVNHHVIIKDNFLSGTDYNGITLTNSPNSIIQNNTISDAGWLAINVLQSHNTTVEQNSIFSVNTGGIEIKNAQDVTFKDNTVTDSPGFGVKLDSVQNITVENNIITNTSLQGVEIESIASITSNILIKNNSLLSTGGINLKGTHLKIVNNLIHSPGADPALWIDSGFHNNLISNNFITAGVGIRSEQSHNNQIHNNYLNTTHAGISISSGLNNSIINNYLTGLIGLNNVNSSLIKQNTIIESDQQGLFVIFSSHNLFEANIAFKSADSGLVMDHGDIFEKKSINNTIKNNLFANNSYHGINLRIGAENNTIKFNDIVFNNIDFSSIQGYDDGIGNVVDQNYWGSNLSSINLEGATNNKDLNPAPSFDHFKETIFSITETTDRLVTLNWESGFAENYEGTYEIFYSTDQGMTWFFVDTYTGFSCVFDTSIFTNQTLLTFKLRVKDILGFYYEIESKNSHIVISPDTKIPESTEESVNTNSLDMLFIISGVIAALILTKRKK